MLKNDYLMGTDATIRECDALIVGAGPAGLFAALSLVAAGVEDVLIVDAGPDIAKRRRASDLSREVGRGRPDLERGVGGAGLFSDGKLCLSLDVGGHLEESLDTAQRNALIAQIEGVFRRLVDWPLSARDLDEDGLRNLGLRAAENGLRFKYYPVAHLGTDRCGDIVAELRRALASGGVSFQPDTELLELLVQRSSGEKAASVRSRSGLAEIRANNVILAMGKVGADRQAALCRNLGIGLRSQPIYTGVRFETSADSLAQLFAVTKDPKYSVSLEDGSKVKTHCASEQGEVIELRYSGLPLAGGHNYSYAQTSRSGFSVLWDGLDQGDASYETALEIMRRAASAGDGGLLVQRMRDYRADRPSRAADLAGLPLTCRTAGAGDVRQLLPVEFFTAMDLLLEKLEGLAPGLVDGTSVVYAPAIEWWMEQVVVEDRFMSTAVPGISVCGDGSGWSQGIVHAAATGLLAGAGLHGRQVDVAKWLTAQTSVCV
jgi:uncharacterized FAD-dependent dehydrogenase